jgi:hypothetical protein
VRAHFGPASGRSSEPASAPRLPKRFSDRCCWQNLGVDAEAKNLLALHEACGEVLAHLDPDDDRSLAIAIRETCERVEERLRSLGFDPSPIGTANPEELSADAIGD